MIDGYKIVIVMLIALPVLWWAPEHGLLPNQVLWSFPTLCYILFVYQLWVVTKSGRRFKTFGSNLVVVFLLITVMSVIWNESHGLAVLLSLRLFISGYLFFLAVINMRFNQQMERKLVKVVFLIFLAHIPIAGIKLMTFGSNEIPLGLIGHALTTYVFLFAFSFLTAFYVVYKPSPIYLLLGLSFTVVVIAGGKRAPFFLVPIVAVIQMWFIRDKLQRLFLLMVVIVLIGGAGSYLTLRLIPTLNPYGEVWGEFDPRYALEYAMEYNSTETKEETRGRTVSTKKIHSDLWKDGPITFLLGRGPGFILKSQFKIVDVRDEIPDRSGVGYGINGLNWLSIQYGFAGAVTWYLLFVLIGRIAIKCFRNEKDTFWRAFALGMIGSCSVFVPISIYYSPIYANAAISIIFFSMAGVLHHRYQMLQAA